MADDTPEAEMTARFEQTRQSTFEWLERELKDHPSELARRKAEYDQRHRELLADALKHEADRRSYTQGRS